jgi:putative flavoprotein involved in K+ transport
MVETSFFHEVIVVGAGPGGLAAAAAVKAKGISDCVVIDRGEVGQSWLDYPTDTHLLSETAQDHDDNMIADVKTTDVLPNIPHPSHIMYQKYLQTVAQERNIEVIRNTTITKVYFNPEMKHFFLRTQTGEEFEARYVIWAAGMYLTPNDSMDAEGCYIHYAHLPYLEHITSPEITVVGSANGASGVIMQLAKPGRVVTLVTSKPYVVPQPIDCLWKEDMKFVEDLAKQGLVKIVENFRVKRIFQQDDHYVLESEDGQTVTALKKPILCTGFALNIEPVKELVQEICEGHDVSLDIDEHHQSKKQPGLFFAGVDGKFKGEEGMIIKFREYAPVIATQISV